MFDLLVLGSGIAGLTTALHAARSGMSVLVVTKGELSHSATRYAQGGVAAALAAPDSPDLHLADTLVAGAGLCDTDAVRVLVDVEVRERWFALEILVERGRCGGVLALDPNGEPHYVRALDTVLATGGTGQ